MQGGTVARRVVVHGRVQGVFFRASTRDQARRHAVAGWVRNRPDGSVEAWLEGRGRDVEAVLAWIHAGGPRHASVEHVEVAQEEPEGHRGFRVSR
ncbi:MAG: acylphosphatase [Nitriliruptoraceae bacterium]